MNEETRKEKNRITSQRQSFDLRLNEIRGKREIQKVESNDKRQIRPEENKRMREKEIH